MNKVVLDETKLRKAMKDALSFDLLVKHTKLRFGNASQEINSRLRSAGKREAKKAERFP